MSNKQKILIPTFESLFPSCVESIMCQAFKSNMKRDGFKGTSVKNELWVAAKATTVEDLGKRGSDETD